MQQLLKYFFVTKEKKKKLVFPYERAVVFPKREIYELKLCCHPPTRISTPIKMEGSSPPPNCTYGQLVDVTIQDLLTLTGKTPQT